MNKEIDKTELQRILRYEDGKLYWNIRKSGIKNPEKECGYIDSYGYRVIKINGKFYKAHRLVYLYHKGCFPDGMIDHIDGDKLNNKIENLRSCTNRQNQYNSKKPVTNKSGVKGIYKRKGGSKYEVYCRHNGKNNYLGSFSDLEEAKKVLEKFREENHKEFCNHG